MKNGVGIFVASFMAAIGIGHTGGRRYVSDRSSAKSERTAEQVADLKQKAQEKRDRKNAKRFADYKMCICWNQCLP